MNLLEKIYRSGNTVLKTYKVYKELFYIILTCIIPFLFKICSDNYLFYLSLTICLIVLWVVLIIEFNQKKVSLIQSPTNSEYLLAKYANGKRYRFILSLAIISGIIFSIFQIYYSIKINNNKIVVLIVPFKNETDSSKDIFSAKLIGELNEQLDTDKSIQVKLLEKPVSEGAGGIKKAITIAKEKKASILVWGWYSKSPTHVFLKTKFEILDSTIQNVIPDLNIKNDNKVFKISQLNSFELQTKFSSTNSFLVFSCLGYLKYIQYKWNPAMIYFDKALRSGSDSTNMATVNFFKGNCFLSTEKY